jgi:hypothetical protein
VCGRDLQTVTQARDWEGKMMRVVVAAGAVVLMLAYPAWAGDATKQGSNTGDRSCYNYPQIYVGEGCRFKSLADGGLRVRATDARATARYRFRVPRNATIDHIRIAWKDPSDIYTCYGETKRSNRDGRRLTVDAVSGRRGHITVRHRSRERRLAPMSSSVECSNGGWCSPVAF